MFFAQFISAVDQKHVLQNMSAQLKFALVSNFLARADCAYTCGGH
jgi:hypothetical protein